MKQALKNVDNANYGRCTKKVNRASNRRCSQQISNKKHRQSRQSNYRYNKQSIEDTKKMKID